MNDEQYLTLDAQIYIEQGKIAMDICTIVNNSRRLKEMIGSLPGDKIMLKLKAWLEGQAND